ncbi:hypothetical protein ACHAW5_001586 [Stephanodiscus triporus]|uniref:Uncharacterized protein n=1 Tax=Stephanodiscus triporus TaxID=2934178 RepID=A0ABD3NKH2_9STRA
MKRERLMLLVVFEVAISFPECVEMFLQDCLDTINSQVQSLGLATIETVVHEKRNLSQPGYNKVVIITDKPAERVMGQAGDGIVTYPFLWDDAVSGLKSLGVDGAPPSIPEEITLSVTSTSRGGKTNPREMIAFSSNCRRMGECTKRRLSSKVRGPQGCQK